MSDEAAFLAAIRATPADDLLRLVYADWLDERGRAEGAFLRAECELAALTPDHPLRSDAEAALREAGRSVAPGWLAAVSRVPVENCGLRFRFRCSKRWESLGPTGEDGVRFCNQCRQQVFFCTSIAVAQTHAALGECVAIDPRLARMDRDLESEVFGDDDLLGMLDDEEPEPGPKDEPPRRRK